jgi:Zn-dependent protease
VFENISIGTILISYVAILFSLSVHEASHAGMAYLLDDDTAARLGRLTLNPIAHIDWIGTVLLPLMGMITGWRVLGWAKPVPVDPSRLTRKFSMRVGYAMVAGAGPASNFVLSALFMLLLGLYVRLGFPTDSYTRVTLFSMAMGYPVEDFLRMGQFSVGQVVALTLMGRLVIINVGLAIFNLLPVGPLDGAGILRGFLPQRYLATFDRIQPTISIVLLVMFLVGFIGVILGPLFWLADTFYITPFARLILGV